MSLTMFEIWASLLISRLDDNENYLSTHNIKPTISDTVNEYQQFNTLDNFTQITIFETIVRFLGRNVKYKQHF